MEELNFLKKELSLSLQSEYKDILSKHKRFVICLVGESGCGKTYLALQMAKVIPSCSIINVGDLVQNCINQRGGTALDLKNNEVIFSLLLDEMERYSEGWTLIITGIRESYIIERLIKGIPNCLAIAVCVSEETRIERLLKRGLSKKQIEEKIKEEKKIGVKQAMESCRFVVINE